MILPTTQNFPPNCLSHDSPSPCLLIPRGQLVMKGNSVTVNEGLSSCSLYAALVYMCWICAMLTSHEIWTMIAGCIDKHGNTNVTSKQQAFLLKTADDSNVGCLHGKQTHRERNWQLRNIKHKTNLYINLTCIRKNQLQIPLLSSLCSILTIKHYRSCTMESPSSPFSLSSKSLFHTHDRRPVA